MAPRRQRTPDAADSAAPEAETTTVATEAPDPSTDFNPAALEADPNDEDAAKGKYASREASRQSTRRPDPFGSHEVRWPDGYGITLQESDSRGTYEIKFGNGSKDDLPKAFDEIKPILKAAGFRWNSPAWAKELAVVGGSQNDRLRAREENRRIRAMVQDEVLPKVIAAEEAVRGEIPLTDQTRDRINRAVAPVGR